ncbi:MAG TPA: alpha-amylase family glycosyl hydrolase, partial [Longimicrobiaceae bacterium]|nr:alpha-amylase family glycosyl hydrolase [Longimicrobiaceae bacterium]
MTEQSPWWRRGVIYQIYPRSFLDASGDGVGDLPGITRGLDHLRWLGVDAVWISPFYPSPMVDFGYDVTDHCGVDPLFGTLEDFDRLLAEAHTCGIRVVLDFIPNHTSDWHPWFLESRSSRENPKRDWYLWRDPAPDGGPPNNWLSTFGGSAWEWDEATGQYYYHAFFLEQPDLNWANPEVEAAMLEVLRFWMRRGVDGIRVDAVQQIAKDPLFRDNPPNPDYVPGPGSDPYDSLLRVYSCDRPEVHDRIARMRRVLAEYGEDRVLIGEIYNRVERLMAYYGHKEEGCHFPYNFQLITLPWEARTIDAAIRRYESLLPPGAWPNWVLGNHDRHRIATRAGPGQARVAAMLLLTLRGTPTLYYGDEIGMRDVEIPPERVRDPWERNLPGLGRDPERTPLQWSAAPNAGFTTGEPWLPVADDFREVNVEAQRGDPGSLLRLYHRLIELRRAEPALHSGAWEPVDARGDVLAYVRSGGGRRFLVALNLGRET